MKFKYLPKISIVIPVFNTPPKILRECVLSAINQTYKNYEICIADDYSENKFTKKEIINLASKDIRIKVFFSKKHEKISAASNAALRMTTGDYIGLLDHDDILWPNALYEVVKVLNRNPQLELIYTDEDQISNDGMAHIEPMIKPSFNFNFLRTTNYMGHFLVIKKGLVLNVGAFRYGYDGAQDYDLLLRITHKLGIKSNKVFHIPKILYSWRRSKISTAQNFSVNKQLAKKYAIFAQRKALTSDLQKRGIKGEIIELISKLVVL